MNKGIISHIKLKWYFYVLGIIASFIISTLFISISASPTKKEKVSIFLTCYNANNSFFDFIESIKPDYLEIVELNIKHKEDLYYGTVIKGYRKNADILIVPESKLDYIILKDCIVLNDDILKELTDKTYEYYSVDSTNYGLKIYSKEKNKGILDGLVKFNDDNSIEDYYLFINNNSIHMGKYNNSKYDGAIKLLKEILNYEA